MKKRKAQIGDVFAVDLGNGDFAYGQIVDHGYGANCYIVFDYTSATYPEVTELVKRPILIRVFTTDHFIERGHWIVIGNTPPIAKMSFPEYKVGTLTETRVVDYRGRTLRIATKEEEERLGYFNSVNPPLLESVIKAKFGVEEWNPYMEKYLYVPPANEETGVTAITPQQATQVIARSSGTADIPEDEQALFVVFPFQADNAGFVMLGELEDALNMAVERQSAGELDGNEIGLQEGTCTIFLYGPDTDRLLAAVRPVLARFTFPPESYMLQRYGEPGAREERIPLS